MIQEVNMTKQEQVDMYMKCSKKELIEMLIEANKHLNKRLTLTDVVGQSEQLVCDCEKEIAPVYLDEDGELRCETCKKIV